jgi:hypothetical protein
MAKIRLIVPVMLLAAMLTGAAIGQSPQPPQGQADQPSATPADNANLDQPAPKPRAGTAPAEPSPRARTVADDAGAAEREKSRYGGWIDIVSRSLAPVWRWLGGVWQVAAAVQDWLPILLALFNGLLALFAYRLWRSTADLHVVARAQSQDVAQSIAIARSAADAAQKSAEAALLQARAAIGVELPRFELSAVQLAYADQSVRQALKSPSVQVSFTNHGRTTAFVTRKCIELRIIQVLPPEPVCRLIQALDIVEPVESGQTASASASRRLGELSEQQIDVLLSGRNNLWVYGFICFRDFLGMEHKTGFCLRWIPPHREASIGGSFNPEDPGKYIYQTLDRAVAPAEPTPRPREAEPALRLDRAG